MGTSEIYRAAGARRRGPRRARRGRAERRARRRAADAHVRRAAPGSAARRAPRGDDQAAHPRGLLAAPRARRVIAIAEVPRTLSGKVLEVPVKRILMGAAPEQVGERRLAGQPARRWRRSRELAGRSPPRRAAGAAARAAADSAGALREGVSRRGRRMRAPMKRAARPLKRSARTASSKRSTRNANGSANGNGNGEHQSLSNYIQARFDDARARRRTSRSTSSTTSTRPPSRPPRSSRGARTRRARRSCASRRRSASRASPSCRPPRARNTGASTRRARRTARRAIAPLFSLDQNEFEAALAADHLNVEDTARKVSRSSVEALIEAIVSAEKVLVAGTDQMAFFASYLRHLLMLLDLRVDLVASPSQEALSRARPDRRGDARDRALGGSSAPARGARDEARAPPQGADGGDHRRDALRGREARRRSSSTTPPTAPPTCARTPRC